MTKYDLKSLSPTELSSLYSDVVQEHDRRKQVAKRISKLKTYIDQYPEVEYLCQAAQHILFDMKPTETKLGYKIADIYYKIDPWNRCRNDPYPDDLLHDIRVLGFDFKEYVFRTTRYDEYDSGRFFRRS